MRLDQSDHLDWLALLRVRSGRVSKRGDGYLYRGQPFPPVSLVAVALPGLEQAGLVTLAEPDEDGLAAVAPTEAGLARHAELSQRQRAKPGSDADPSKSPARPPGAAPWPPGARGVNAPPVAAGPRRPNTPGRRRAATDVAQTESRDTCPGRGTAHGVQPQPAPPTVQAWTCTACGLHWVTTVVNPTRAGRHRENNTSGDQRRRHPRYPVDVLDLAR